MTREKGSRVLRYNLGEEHVLCIREGLGFSRWSVCNKNGKVIKVVSNHQCLGKLLVIKSDEWCAIKENGCNIVLYRRDFHDGVVGLLLFFHEIGHLVNWGRFSWKERKKDERCAWAFSFKEMRRFERELEIKLLTFKRYGNFRKKIHRWIDNHKTKK